MSASIWEPGDDVPLVNANSTLVPQNFTVSSYPTTLFNLTAFTYVVGTGSLSIYINGVKQRLGIDFVETSNSSFTLLESPLLGDVVTAEGFVGVSVSIPDAEYLRLQLVASTGALMIGTSGYDFLSTTNVEQNLVEIVNKLNTALTIQTVQEQVGIAYGTAGSSTAYSVDMTGTTVPADSVNTRLQLTFDETNTNTTPTLQLTGWAPRPIRVFNSLGAKVLPEVAEFVAGAIYDVVFDGTYFLALTQLPPANTASGSFKNKIINGDFNFWRYAITQSTSGYGSDDRFLNQSTGSTKVHSRQQFTLGQTAVPGDPNYYSRTVVTSVAGVGNFVTKAQRIEDVRRLANRTITVSFYAKADSAKNIALSMLQNFGTTGSPSADVGNIGAQQFILSTAWTKYTATIAMPSISGKTIGTIDSSFTELKFWFDAGSNFNASTVSLGQQSGTFDIALVQVEEGAISSGFEWLPQEVELALCERYLPDIPSGGGGGYMGQCYGSTTAFIFINFRVTARSAPTGITVSAFTDFGVADAVFSTNIPCTNVGLSGSRGTYGANLVATVASGLVAGNAAIFDKNVVAGKILFTGCEL